MFLIVVKIWEPTVPPHGAPMEPLQGATFEKSVPAPLLTYCDKLTYEGYLMTYNHY